MAFQQGHAHKGRDLCSAYGNSDELTVPDQLSIVEVKDFFGTIRQYDFAASLVRQAQIAHMSRRQGQELAVAGVVSMRRDRPPGPLTSKTMVASRRALTRPSITQNSAAGGLRG